MDQELCQKEPGGVLKALAPIGIGFLRLSPHKIALFSEKSRRDFNSISGWRGEVA